MIPMAKSFSISHLFDRQACHVYVSSSACEATGYNRKELLEMTVFDTYPDIRKKDWDDLWKTARDQDSCSFRTSCRRKNGAVFPVEANATYMKLDGGEYLLLNGRSLTEIENVDSALNLNGKSLEKLLSAATQFSIIATDMSGLITVFNSGAERMLGYTSGEMVGKKTPEIIHLKSEVIAWGRELSEQLGIEAKGFDVFVARAKRGHFDEKECTYVTKDGRHLTVNLIVTAVKDEAGDITGFLGIAQDITSRKQAENRLRESEERFHRFADSSPVMIWMSGNDKSFYYFNKTWLDFTGRTPDQEIGMGWAEGVHIADLQQCLDTFNGAFDRREPFRIEYRLRRNDGEFRWIFDIGTPQFGSDGSFEGYIGTCIDITERKQALEELDRYFQLAGDMFCIADVQGYFLRINKAFERTLGYTAQELLSLPIIGLVHPDDIQVTQSVMMELIEGREVADFQNRYRRSDGSYIWISWNATPIPQEGLIYAVARDISERRMMEESLRQSEQRYRNIFWDVSISIWEEDISGVLEKLELLRLAGVSDLREFLSSNQAAVIDLMREIKVIDVNDATLDLYGASTKEELLGSLDKIMNPASLPTFIELVAALAEGRTSFEVEGLNQTLKGDTINVLMRISMPSNIYHSGRILVSILNITDRKKAEYKLRQSEAELAEAQRIAGTGNWSWDIEKDEVRWSAQTFRIFGLDQDKFKASYKTFLELVHPEDRVKLQQAIEKTIRNKETYHIQHRLIRPDGEIRWAYGQAETIFDEQGKPVRIVGTVQDITERIRAEEALKESEERLSLVIRGTGVGLWDWNVQTGELVINELWAEIVGYELSELQPVSIKTWIDLAHPDDLKRSNELLGKHFSGDLDLYDFECRMRHKDGDWIWVHDRGKVVEWTTDGKPLRMTGTHSNITRRRHLEEERSFLASIVESTPDAVIGETKEGVIRSVNRGAEQLYGYSEKELLGNNMQILSPPEKQDEFARIIKIIKSGKRLKDYQTVRLRKDGSLIDVSLTVSPILDSEKQMIGSSSIARDITERKQAQETIRDNEERLRSILNNIIDGIIIANEKGIIEAINPAVVRIFGYEEKDLIGSNVRILMPEPYKSDHDRYLENYQKTGEAHVIGTGREVTGLKKDGSVFPLDLSIVEMKLGGGKKFVGVTRDITERKRAQQEMERLLHEVEGANRELKDFAYVISHDLKAPLRAIGSLVSWISSDYSDKIEAEGQEMINLLEGRVKRMHDLIDGVLEYSRVGRIREEQVEINLNELVEEVTGFIGKPENFLITVEKKLPTVCLERTRIQQLFQNLISNAIKYNDKTQGEVRISCERDGDFWRFRVSDNGPGIDSKYFEKIFQIFQTLAARDDVDSTGVGLSLVKKIVEMYGGRVWVESELGKGATFLFTLPVHKG